MQSRAKGPIGQTVLEVLGTLMTAELAEAVLRRGLERAGRTRIPENPQRVRELAEGSLRLAIVELVGTETADSFVRDLGPILEVISSGVSPKPDSDRPRSILPPSRSSSAPPPRRDEAPLRLLVVTADSLEELKRQVGSFADLGRVRDAFELITEIETRGGPVLVVVDGYRPAVDVTTLQAFLPRVPDGCRVALWGFSAQEVRRVESLPGYTVVEAGPHWGSLADALLRL